MEVKVGISHVQREVSLETKATAASVEEALGVALKDNGVFTLTDDKGRKVLIPAAQIAYVDLGSEHARPVGFGAVSA
ncbi:DUF3107 domain-containing protein [Propioniciclava soli]|uniref:DUF3107 domain-containing protein n=1 Tax=Propioniciclava soli TaxID=2775081 RepID=A0ABZ3C3A3_9ACTN|nr:DUF3107 domain-containing protein [Propioniciclava soli]